MILKVIRFFSLLLVTLTFGLTWCHVMEIPGKLRLDGAQWLTVQQGDRARHSRGAVRSRDCHSR